MSRQTLINSTIGEYRLVDKLGEGGMGEVYQGVHLKIGRVVAIKILSQTSHGPEFVERFLNEARIQGGLQHNNIVTLYDFLEYNGQPCIIMEYIEGRTLTDCIGTPGGLLLTDAIRYFQSIVDAIDYVHSRGIVHRDIKSNNVKITASGQVKLLDFGIAKSGASPALTVTGAFVGTLQYLSPEQLIGGVADMRSDIWSLGVLLYEMTTSRLPFEANTIGELCQKISKASYTPPSVMNQNVPREVQNIVAGCLKKNPGARYQSARDLLQEVNRVAAVLSSHSTGRVSSSGSTAQSRYHPATLHPASSQPVFAQPLPYRPSSYSDYSDRQNDSGVAAKPKSRLLVLAVIAAVVFLSFIVGGLYFMLSGDAQSASTNKPAPALETFRIETADGPAEVYRNGRRVGTTPYPFQAKSGEDLELVLKREGYLDKVVRLTTSTNQRTRTFMLERKP